MLEERRKNTKKGSNVTEALLPWENYYGQVSQLENTRITNFYLGFNHEASHGHSYGPHHQKGQ